MPGPSKSRNVNAYVKRVRLAMALRDRVDEILDNAAKRAEPLTRRWAKARNEAQVIYGRLNGAQCAEARRLTGGTT